MPESMATAQHAHSGDELVLTTRKAKKGGKSKAPAVEGVAPGADGDPDDDDDDDDDAEEEGC